MGFMCVGKYTRCIARAAVSESLCTPLSFCVLCAKQENINLMEGEKAVEIAHPQIKYAFQAFQDGIYVARPPLEEKYRQSLQASDYAAPEE